MNLKKLVLTFSLVLFCLPTHGMETANKDLNEEKSSKEDLVKATESAAIKKIVTHDFDEPLPKELQKIIIAQKTLLHFFQNSRENVDFAIAPGWVIKRRFAKLDRIEGAKKFADAINKGNYDQLTIPVKYAINTDLSIAKQMVPINEKVNLVQAKQLYSLAQDLNWGDGANNFAKIAPNMVAIWDTEMCFFIALSDKEKKLKILNSILANKDLFTHEAQDFLLQEKLENQPKTKTS